MSARTRSNFKGGDITVNANSLEVTSGGQVLASTFSSGSAGNLILNIADDVILSGTDPTFLARLQQFNSEIVDNDGSKSGLFSRSQGVGSQGSAAGQINLSARRIALDDRGTITTETTSGQGGAINLNAQQLLLLRRNSQISTTAGTAQQGGDGGNITINTPFVVAVPSENNDITANAFTGNGGRIQITVQGVFGLERRSVLTPLSDITAFSQQNPQLNGVVKINTLDVDPSQGLVTLPAELVDASRLIALGCGAGRRQEESKFVVTGRGGLPLRPGDAHISHYPTGSVRSIPSSSPSIDPTISVEDSDPSSSPTRVTAPAPLVEATGWVINDKGEVVLTADAPNITPTIPWLTPTTCHSSTHTLPLALSKQ